MVFWSNLKKKIKNVISVDWLKANYYSKSDCDDKFAQQQSVDELKTQLDSKASVTDVNNIKDQVDLNTSDIAFCAKTSTINNVFENTNTFNGTTNLTIATATNLSLQIGSIESDPNEENDITNKKYVDNSLKSMIKNETYSPSFSEIIEDKNLSNGSWIRVYEIDAKKWVNILNVIFDVDEDTIMGGYSFSWYNNNNKVYIQVIRPTDVGEGNFSIVIKYTD